MAELESDKQTFPTLDQEQIDAVRPFGEELNLPTGSILYRRGDRDFDFYVVLDGGIEVLSVDCRDRTQHFITLRPGNFSGELSLFSHQRALVTTRTASPSRLLRLHWPSFRRLLSEEPELAKIVLRAYVRRRTALISLGISVITLIGSAKDPDTLRLRQFLTGVGFPHRWVEPTEMTDEGGTVLESTGLSESDLPVIWEVGGMVLKNPSLTKLAEELGFFQEIAPDRIFDVAVVGAGPAGLASAVFAASEGLDTIVFDSSAPGGQAGTSSRIENYLGFPNGLSGQELTARAQIQAEKFGAHMMVATPVGKVHRNPKGEFEIRLCDDRVVRARAIVVASGAAYRKLDLPECPRYEGRGIHYAATPMEAQLCLGEEVVVVGGGNSAGQAAVYLSGSVAKVHMMVRSESLSSSMSKYLIQRIQASPKIQVYYNTEITKLTGEKTLEEVEWKNSTTGEVVKKPIRTLFCMIGAIPNTGWLRGCTTLNDKGFVVTGKTRVGNPYETEQAGVFAVGDVRADSVKRIASAVGEGSIVIQWVQRHLDDLRRQHEEAEIRRRQSRAA